MNKIYKTSIFLFLIIISMISTFYFISISYSESIIKNKNLAVDLLIDKELNNIKRDKRAYEINLELFSREDFANLVDENKK